MKPKFFISKAKIEKYTDIAVKMKKNIPPPGIYNIPDTSYDKITRGPSPIRRH